MTNEHATKELLFKMADDALIIGHRNSEWTGIGPTIEEDIAFSSMSQDKIGHAQALYTLLHEHFNEADPDALGFGRTATNFKSCWLVELPIGAYDFTLMRHFLFDHAEILRYQSLQQSSFTPLAQLSGKIIGEIKYHILHANTWVKQLSTSTEEAHARIQTALNTVFPYALGIFETGDNEQALINDATFIGEQALQAHWYQKISGLLNSYGLTVPNIADTNPVYGGRKGFHSEHLSPLLIEMTEVFRIDETAEW